ncbi:adenine-specific DNA-methyltransferase [Candidatus Hakubella thermalkaliphila]|uniref:Adenine-specific DNA-methyltransferase n=2 Tax=Candidatus Hakubella thermalkaliphila TaxID=2754717 RepID=A0A6V8PII1_9ACTN|nr:adenine-specific DNA-methyltransferase [Candidatus Hakubella thermalkaliphila]GFP37298.1 adenine-specific DNA-methyltransferase [Candidatus Hakubella thermalkaliphila]GFP42823.1 adenine-specific DNA-methyltransferase [Candidatus Hakubella thermalkaliphila]
MNMEAKMPENKIKVTPAKGRPMLNWVGKKPLDYVKGFPTQLVEVFDPLNTGRIVTTPTYDELKDNWQNLLFHGDNKDVLATLLELGFRGKIDLTYIDPPFKSGADYVRKVELRGLKKLGRIAEDEASILQQTMYFDIWNNDTYLQFMYERLMLLKELLSETGSIYVHLDWHVSHYIKLLMDEIFGEDNFIREIIWRIGWVSGYKSTADNWIRNHETILYYGKNKNKVVFNKMYTPYPPDYERWMGRPKGKGFAIEDVWGVFPQEGVTSLQVVSFSSEYTGFVTQKPEGLLERIIKASSNEGDLILDCFIGSGTTARVAQNLSRRWIGCDINKGAIQLTSERLQGIISEQIKKEETKYPTFSLYKVNDYDLRLLQTEAIELAAQHIGIQRTRTDRFFDGYLGKNIVKIIDFNHPLTLLDLELIQDELKKRPDEDRDITIVCLGKELAVDPWIDEWNKKHPVNKIRIIELKTDKKYGSFLIHKPAEAKISIKRKNSKAIIEIKDFISPTIIERLNIDNKLFKVKIPDSRSIIDCVLIDNNYDGNTFHIIFSDVPEKKNDLVSGKYEVEVPKKKTKVAVKIIDMLGEEVLFIKEI